MISACACSGEPMRPVAAGIGRFTVARPDDWGIATTGNGAAAAGSMPSVPNGGSGTLAGLAETQTAATSNGLDGQSRR